MCLHFIVNMEEFFSFFILLSGRTDLAVKQYLKAIEIQPNHTVALVNAARTLRSMKHMKKAETLYKRYVLATHNAILNF